MCFFVSAINRFHVDSIRLALVFAEVIMSTTTFPTLKDTESKSEERSQKRIETKKHSIDNGKALEPILNGVQQEVKWTSSNEEQALVTL